MGRYLCKSEKAKPATAATVRAFNPMASNSGLGGQSDE